MKVWISYFIMLGFAHLLSYLLTGTDEDVPLILACLALTLSLFNAWDKIND